MVHFDPWGKEPERSVLPGPGNPMGVARELIKDHQYDGELTLRHWRGGWVEWEDTHWAEGEDLAIRTEVYKRLEQADYWHVQPATTRRDEFRELRPWMPTRAKVSDVLDALSACVHTREGLDMPSWLNGGPNGLSGPNKNAKYCGREIVACANGLLHVPTRKLLDLTPGYFNRVAVPFPYEPAAPKPTKWSGFLDQLWDGDQETIDTLQEFVGYLLSGRTDLQKMLLVIGPPRSGKGTIARTIASLLGLGNVAGPTLASFATNFGLSPLLGKPLAIVSDARLGKGEVHQVVERLLSITGEDMLTVDRKYKAPWSGKLPTRFMILSNELPRFGDASGAIANRFVILVMTKSFLGHEDPTLTDEIAGDLPGILSWALDGLDRLVQRGRFTEPQASVEAARDLKDLVSPAAAFVRDRCDVKPEYDVLTADLFREWRSWCEENGHHASSSQTFGRDLRAVLPQIGVSRPRDDGDRVYRYTGIRIKSSSGNWGDRSDHSDQTGGLGGWTNCADCGSRFFAVAGQARCKPCTQRAAS